MLKTFRPDAVLLDLMLPKVNGIELMKQIRAEAGFQQTPVIVFSNTYLSNMVQDAWKAGATKCLSKANCTPKQIIEVVRQALNPPSPATAPKAGAAPQTDLQEPQAVAQADAEFQAGLRQTFIEGLSLALTGLRSSLQHVIKAGDETTRLKHLQEMSRRIHALAANAGMSGVLEIAQMSDALEALLKELYEKPVNLNASTLRTVASAVDLLAILFERANTPEKELPAANVLVVDDEAISRRAVVYALDKANLKSVPIEDPVQAFKLISQGRFDLIFLDVDMPNMNGFELCSKIRTLPAYKKTPIVFVTSLTTLDSRANSMMSGGNDFIAKPFLFIELTVKALGHVLRSRLEAAKRPAPVSV
jgi:DNA-binding response OmpR family regulator